MGSLETYTYVIPMPELHTFSPGLYIIIIGIIYFSPSLYTPIPYSMMMTVMIRQDKNVLKKIR